MAELTPQQQAFFAEQGYLVVDSKFPAGLLDRVIDDLEAVWDDPGYKGVTYLDRNRIQDAWRVSSAVRDVAIHPRVLTLLGELYEGARPLPFQTLNFRTGTEQKVHADTIHFNSEPYGMMCGAWLALEDVGPDQGPLVYYPTSQQRPEQNMPELGLDLDRHNYADYEAVIESQLTQLDIEPVYGHIKKGQILIWSAGLLHGGSNQLDKSLSRHSQVTHYYFDHCRYWRPLHSYSRRHYFRPNWIPYDGSGRYYFRWTPFYNNVIRHLWNLGNAKPNLFEYAKNRLFGGNPDKRQREV